MKTRVPTHGVKAAGLCLAASLILGVAMANADEAPAAAAAEATTNAPAAAAPAPTKDWSVTSSQDYFSQYVFRGVTILDHNAIWSPSVIATYKNLTAYYYGYFGSGNDTVPGNRWYEEDDFAADLHQAILNDKLTMTAGMYGYIYPDGVSGKDTYEFYGKAAWADYFNPYIGLNWDVHVFHGGYGYAGVTHTYDVTDMLKLKDGHTLSITPSAQLGIDFGYNWRGSKDNVTWNDVLLGLNMSYGITSALSVHAMYQLSVALNSVHALGVGNQSIFNLGATYAF
ncbi:MAG TPA: hypothetical protein VLZ12_11790 [Verrucomicrobiae bacterium]|nr:hypothetical protein [Verrucomicrobiae bacterium]